MNTDIKYAGAHHKLPLHAYKASLTDYYSSCGINSPSEAIGMMLSDEEIINALANKEDADTLTNIILTVVSRDGWHLEDYGGHSLRDLADAWIWTLEALIDECSVCCDTKAAARAILKKF